MKNFQLTYPLVQDGSPVVATKPQWRPLVDSPIGVESGDTNHVKAKCHHEKSLRQSGHFGL